MVDLSWYLWMKKFLYAAGVDPKTHPNLSRWWKEAQVKLDGACTAAAIQYITWYNGVFRGIYDSAPRLIEAEVKHITPGLSSGDKSSGGKNNGDQSNENQSNGDHSAKRKGGKSKEAKRRSTRISRQTDVIQSEGIRKGITIEPQNSNPPSLSPAAVFNATTNLLITPTPTSSPQRKRRKITHSIRETLKLEERQGESTFQPGISEIQLFVVELTKSTELPRSGSPFVLVTPTSSPPRPLIPNLMSESPLRNCLCWYTNVIFLVGCFISKAGDARGREYSYGLVRTQGQWH